jgi:hypothetical protein
MHLFTNDQKRQISKLAKRAYDQWEGREAFEECNPTMSRSACFSAWRHAETLKATGYRTQSLREAISERDYLPLLAHFSHFLGDGAGALKHLLRHAEGARIQIFFKLQQALAERGLDEAYAVAICRRQYKCDLGDASEKQLWSLFFTVRNRRKVAAPTAHKPAPKRIKESLGTLSVATIEKRLAAAVQSEDYEQAAQLRDEISAHAALASDPC